METLLVIAGLIAVGWGWYRLKAAARKKLNKDVFQRKEHALGQRITGERLTFTSELAAADILTAVRVRLDLAETRPPLPRLYLAGADDEGLVFAQGSKLGDSFQAVLAAESTDSGCHGEFAVLTWTEADGIVGHLDDLEYLRGAVEKAISATDPGARFEVVPQ